MSFKQGRTERLNSFNENTWIITIRNVIEEEREDIDNLSISIFDVPKSLMVVKPETYIPQQVAIGPYHLWRTDLYEMRRYKLFAARRTQKLIRGNLKFKDIVDHFATHEFKIRASYHKSLDVNRETLAWMMALDASFLLEFLQIIVTKHGKVLTRVCSSRTSHLIHSAGNISTHNAIHRDIMMLENQIPLFLLRELLGFSMPKPKVDESLAMLLNVLYREVSPFKNLNNFPQIEELVQRNHILEFLYYMIVPNQVASFEHPQNQTTEESSFYFQFSKKLFDSVSNSAPFRSIKRVLTLERIKIVSQRTWQFASKFATSSKKEPLENIISSRENVVDEVDDDEFSSELPLIEELMIPSVTDLCNVGVKFRSTKGGLHTIKFDAISLTFHLPIITLDENSEVILRNLVAFEACAVAGALVFTRYTELMNGIIDSEEDVKLLRNQGIIVNHLRKDSEVADLWNSMSKSVKLTKVDFLDKTIEDVNRYYDAKWKVRAEKKLKKYMYAFWPLLTLLAAIFLLLSTVLQAFCSVYNCSRVVSKLVE